MFARVKYLLIMKLTTAILFAQVFVMKHQMSCCRFHCFSSGLTCGLLKNYRIPQQLCCFIPTAPVQYQSFSRTKMTVPREWLEDYFLLCAQGTFFFRPRGITLIESTQGLKGLSNCHSNETAVEAARRGPVGSNKNLLSRNIYSNERAGQQL